MPSQCWGIVNTRMKDYFDLLALSREGAIERDTLAEAIAATFRRRSTSLPDTLPLGLTVAFSGDAEKRRGWAAFLTRNRLDAPALDAVIEELAGYLDEPLAMARNKSI